ncbi:hypothetical protein NL676_016756 [Syzygium grande]|nr:hypothetical protein NL676_016756 [Syzygium grande]
MPLLEAKKTLAREMGGAGTRGRERGGGLAAGRSDKAGGFRGLVNGGSAAAAGYPPLGERRRLCSIGFARVRAP